MLYFLINILSNKPGHEIGITGIYLVLEKFDVEIEGLAFVDMQHNIWPVSTMP